jgi:hypothetical protein
MGESSGRGSQREEQRLGLHLDFVLVLRGCGWCGGSRREMIPSMAQEQNESLGLLGNFAIEGMGRLATVKERLWQNAKVRQKLGSDWKHRGEGRERKKKPGEGEGCGFDSQA